MTLSIKELIVEADRCVACGLCLPHCPTYRKTGSEADSPRGRIQLMRAVAQEILPNNVRFNEHIDLCLSCRSCESACPNNVNYGALVDTTRALYIPKKSPFSALVKAFIRNRFLANAFVWLIWFIQKFGLFSLLKRINPAAKVLPVVEKPVTWKSLYPANSEKKGAVSLFLGCAGNALDTHTLQASIQVLNQLGYDVHIPAQQTCCGGIARQMGDAEESSKLVALNQNSFDANLPILTTASGCGAGLNDYLPTHKIQDISAFLMACDWTNVDVNPLNEQIYVQDPCTLRNVQKSHQAVYSLLKKIPNATVTALAGNGQCCGGAGAYMLTQSEMANNLLDDKLNAISANNVAILATSNIGCSLHIANGLREKNLTVSVMHPIQIIAKQMRPVRQV
ncbi:(Fe-S)-binding protein [Methylotenera sp.]|uniref:(Fe-S)-binding protein n=1 Tax=Methylotenera sp. TaxID=2051956 RepID=UPI00248738FF|nr:(Fe-S)-binding protein [Methylotenera sp.]MDI1362890.1 (Fe-S)-binding protein [Methylotenera sp.]